MKEFQPYHYTEHAKSHVSEAAIGYALIFAGMLLLILDFFIMPAIRDFALFIMGLGIIIFLFNAVLNANLERNEVEQ